MKITLRQLKNLIKEEIEAHERGTQCPSCGQEMEHSYDDCRNPECQRNNELDEVAPSGWEGTVRAMKKHKNIKNPWALAYSMQNKGYKHHK